MGINLDKDCVTRSDGSKLYYDIEQKKFALFTKKIVSEDDVTKDEVIQLMKIVIGEDKV